MTCAAPSDTGTVIRLHAVDAKAGTNRRQLVQRGIRSRRRTSPQPRSAPPRGHAAHQELRLPPGPSGELGRRKPCACAPPVACTPRQQPAVTMRTVYRPRWPAAQPPGGRRRAQGPPSRGAMALDDMQHAAHGPRPDDRWLERDSPSRSGQRADDDPAPSVVGVEWSIRGTNSTWLCLNTHVLRWQSKSAADRRTRAASYVCSIRWLISKSTETGAV